MQMGRRVERTRNGGTYTESQFWSMIRSTLRRRSMYWKPIKYALEAARRKYTGPNKRQKWEFQCADCGNWYIRKDVEVDHIQAAGSLKCYDDLPGFVERLFCEDPECYAVRCKKCHLKKTKEDGKKRRSN